ncbi:hypothetical protein TWF694_003799 [Orbilia ellipsospora]|uniref:Uncharacterized protein n=1 Tax=Orbilia ellipsospora TaxID=2528407 RepID=A0AAV9WZ74_9PEZI
MWPHIFEFVTFILALATTSSAWVTIAMDEYGTKDCTGPMLYTHWPSVTDCINVDYFTNSIWINAGSGYFAGVAVAHFNSGCSLDSRIGRIPGLNDTGTCIDANNTFPLARPWGGRIKSIMFQ